MKKVRAKITVNIMMLLVICLMPFTVMAGNLEPSGSPAPTMKTLDEIPPSWHQILPTSERFVLVMGDEAVLDQETGLVWARNANLFGEKNWYDAQQECFSANIGGRYGWRCPTPDELSSLIDSTQSSPKLPSGHPFINLQYGDQYPYPFYYWSSMSYPETPQVAWFTEVYYGNVGHNFKTNEYFVWPVRGGK